MRSSLVLIAFLCSIVANAQMRSDTSGRVFLFSSVGLSSLQKGTNPSFGSSVQTATGLGYKLSPHSSLAVTLSFDSYGYKKSGTAYTLDGTLRTTGLAAFYKYNFGRSQWLPYIKAGGGGARLSVPTVTTGAGTTTITNEKENLGLFLAEAGLQIRVVTRYSLFVGAEGRWIGQSGLLNNAALRPVTIKAGLISSF